MATEGCTPSGRRPRLGALLLAVACALVTASPAHAALWSDAQPTEVTVRTGVSGVSPVVAEIGTTTAYGRTVGASVVSSDPEGAGPIAVARVTGLEPNTVYHWRMRETAGGVASADATVRTSPDGAPVLETAPSAAYVGTGPTARCDGGAWDDPKATLSYLWANDTSPWVLSPISVASQTLTYSVAGRYRCTVTARNAAGTSTASVLFSALSARIPLQVSSRPVVTIEGEGDARQAACRGWAFTGGGGAESVSYRWFRNSEALGETGETLAMPPQYGGRIICVVIYTRGQQTQSASSDVYDDGQPPPPPPPPLVAVAPARQTAAVASTDPPARVVVIGSPGDPGAAQTSVDLEAPFGLGDAKTMARQALDEEFGRAWRQRRALRLACTQRTATRYRCKVSWQYRGLYQGDVWIVVPTAIDEPITVSVEVSRPAGKKFKKRWVTARELKRLAALETDPEL